MKLKWMQKTHNRIRFEVIFAPFNINISFLYYQSYPFGLHMPGGKMLPPNMLCVFCFRLRPVDINLNWRETENLLWSNTHFSPTLYLLLQQCKVMNVCYHLSSFPTFNFRFLLTIHSLIWSISWSKRSLNTFVKFLRRNIISPHNIYIIEIGALSVIFWVHSMNLYFIHI